MILTVRDVCNLGAALAGRGLPDATAVRLETTPLSERPFAAVAGGPRLVLSETGLWLAVGSRGGPDG